MIGSQKRSRTWTDDIEEIATMLEDAERDILAFYALQPRTGASCAPPTRSSASTSEIGRRTDVVGIFPDDRTLIRLAGMLCIERNDEWLVGSGYLSAESISLILAGRDDHPTNEIKEEVPELQPA